MEVNILAMLQTAIATAVILGIGMVGLYAWLKHTGQLKRDRHHEGHPH